MNTTTNSQTAAEDSTILQPQREQIEAAPQMFQVFVLFKTKHFTLGTEQRGVLEWSHDNHIRLHKLDPGTGESMGTVFDVIPTDIQKIGGIGNSMFFYLRNGNYTAIFSEDSVESPSYGVVGWLIASRLHESETLYKWLESFKKHGVRTNFMGHKKIITLMLIISAFIITVMLINDYILKA